MQINQSKLILIQGDITTCKVDGIVNAANSGLMGGGGVDGAIHRAGGPIILEQCKEIIKEIGSLPTGEAVITDGGNLLAKKVIHTVGPIWYGGDQGEEEKLANAYRNSLTVAEEHGLQRIAFPSISTGVYRFPIEQAAQIALNTINDYLQQDTKIKEVIMVLFSHSDYKIYQDALDKMLKR